MRGSRPRAAEGRLGKVRTETWPQLCRGDLSPDSGTVARACLKPVGEAGVVGGSESRPLSAGGPPQRGGCGKVAPLLAGGMSWWSSGEEDPKGVSAWAENRQLLS